MNATIDDRSAVVSGDVLSEPTRLVVQNTGKDPHQVYLAKLNDGVDEADVLKALEKGPDALFEILVIAGSLPGEGTKFGRVSSGKTGELVVDFPEGMYMLIDPEVNGPPPFTVFEIGPSTAEVTEPEAAYTVEAGDFYFEVDELQAGPSTVKITNTGEQGHEVSVSSGDEEWAFSFAPPPGGVLWTTFDLPPGSHEVVCYFPDVKTGKPHFKLGMKAKLTVE